MVVNTEVSEVTSSGVTEVTQSRIIASAQMIKLLSSGLYQDKVMAVLRELSANAIDAMKMAGTLESHQYEIHLPTTLEPWFSIRDYGTGLSDEGMKRVYINYGSSTKSSDNDQIGGFGVGSKAPFSYCKQYTIVSYYNGVKSSYNYGIGASGTPELSKISAVATDLHNGLEVQLAVATKDFSEFERKAIQLYRFFDYKPASNIQLAFPDEKVLFSDSTGTIAEVGDVRYGNPYAGLFIKMGGIVYKAQLDMWAYGDDIRDFAYYRSVMLNVDIGEIEVTASREAVESTPGNKIMLESKYKDLMSSFVDWINNDIDSIPNTWDKVKTLQLISNLPRQVLTRITSVKTASNNHGISHESISFKSITYNGSSTHVRKGNHIYISPQHCGTLIICDRPMPANIVDVIKPHLPSHYTGRHMVWLVYPTGGGKNYKNITVDTIVKNLGEPSEYLILSELCNGVTTTKSSSPTPEDQELLVYQCEPAMYYSLHGTPNMRASIHGSTPVKAIPSNIQVFYYIDADGDVPYIGDGINTLGLILDKLVGAKNYILVRIAKSNLSRAKRLSQLVSVVDYVNKLTITVLDVTELTKCTPSNNTVYYNELEEICSVHSDTVLPRTHAMFNALKMCRNIIVGTSESIKFMQAIGIKFVVTKYKLPPILQDYRERFAVYGYLQDRHNRGLSNLAYVALTAESIKASTIQDHIKTDYQLPKGGKK